MASTNFEKDGKLPEKNADKDMTAFDRRLTQFRWYFMAVLTLKCVFNTDS